MYGIHIYVNGFYIPFCDDQSWVTSWPLIYTLGYIYQYCFRVRAIATLSRWSKAADQRQYLPVRRTHTQSTLSSPWSGPHRLIPCVGISANQFTSPHALSLSLYSHCLCHLSSFSWVCSRLSRRTTLIFHTPVQSQYWRSRAPRSPSRHRTTRIFYI